MIDIEAAKETIRETLNPLIKNCKNIAFFDFPNYANVGDSAIWLGTMDYLKENASSSPIIWMSDKKTLSPNNLPVFDKKTLLIIHGGGNYGDLWEDHQRHRELIIQSYPNNRIIQLPQSIHFQNESNLKDTKSIIAKHKDFHFVVRDQKSFEIAKTFEGIEVYLCPDMAFYIKRIPKLKEPKHDVVALIRTDKESVISEDCGKCAIPIFDWLSEPITAAVRFDTFMSHYPSVSNNYPLINNMFRLLIYKRLANERFKRGCDLLMQGKVVITDRLHAHIMCTLLGIPSVVLDNSYGKIKNVLETWESDSKIAYQVDSFDGAVALAASYLQS